MGESRMQRKLPVRFGGGWAETDARKRARRRPSTLRYPPPHLTHKAEQLASVALAQLTAGLPC